MSNTIGFSNFRRFANFQEIDLGDITILVGGNNSGKSTIVKALLLCVDNLIFMRMNDRRHGESKSFLAFDKPLFRFDANEFHDVKIKEFARAIHNKPVEEADFLSLVNTKKKALPTAMTFRFTLGQFHFTFVVSGNRDERSTTGNIERIVIEDKKSHVKYENDYQNHSMSYEVINTDFEEQLTLVKKLISDYRKAKKAFDIASEEGNLEAITNVTASLDKMRMQITAMLDRDSEDEELSEDEMLSIIAKNLFKNKPTKASYEMPLGILYNEVAEPVVLNVISNIHNFATTKGVAPKFKSGDDPNIFGAELQNYELMESCRKAMILDERIFVQSRRDLQNLLASFKIEYISAHAANQNTLYNTADKNDYIAQTVHNFWREKINPGDREYEFVREWMQKFEIGIDFKISPLVPGEAYTVSITEESGTLVPLADKGMGSIQMMILLLRLATILNKYKNHHDVYNLVAPIIVIEEPEQNLHPKMQSLLADLFYHLANYENCKFLIETHSEYLIRKSQVIVADAQFADNEDLKESNKFKVYYLPNDGTEPYEMLYRTDGCFANDFGEGFFDEAENLAFKVL